MYNGEYAFRTKASIAKTQIYIGSMVKIVKFVDLWTLYQFDSTFRIEDWMNKNVDLFVNMSVLQPVFGDLLQRMEIA